MRPTLFLLPLALSLAGATALAAQAELRPAPSGRGTSEVTLTTPGAQGQQGAPPKTIRVDYGQPHLRGRTLHTDSLVPYDRPWRTGANAATTLKTDVPLTLGGVELPAGSYVLFTLPTRQGWKLIVQRGEAQSVMGYDESFDLARVDLRHRQLPQPLESLSMWLIPSTAPGPARGELRIAWGTTEVATDWAVR